MFKKLLKKNIFWGSYEFFNPEILPLMIFNLFNVTLSSVRSFERYVRIIRWLDWLDWLDWCSCSNLT